MNITTQFKIHSFVLKHLASYMPKTTVFSRPLCQSIRAHMRTTLLYNTVLGEREPWNEPHSFASDLCVQGPVYRVRWSPYVLDVFLSCSADWSIKLWHQSCQTPLHSLTTVQVSSTASNSIIASPEIFLLPIIIMIFVIYVKKVKIAEYL